MPGRRLSGEEAALQRAWENPPPAMQRPYLRSIEIAGGTGIRGINGLLVPFRYPLTALCGTNGSGKTTILALATLAYHSPQGWFVHWGNPQPHRQSGDRSYYTFSDFFVRGAGDSPVSDVSITWRHYQDGLESSINFVKRDDRWGTYARRPEREVLFFPLARMLPAHEMAAVRSTFQRPTATITSTPLNAQHRGWLSYIMGRTYGLAEVQRSKRYTFLQAESGSRFTAFNMGGGESCAISLLSLLQDIPNGGLLVVEEIEAGLHPQAQKRLAEVLLKICLSRHLQIICSTHSDTFLDALPRQARLLVKRVADEHEVYESPSTRFAISEMMGEAHPELTVYCEDQAAQTLIEEALPVATLSRVRVQAVGDNRTVVRQAVSHKRIEPGSSVLCVLDGDCTTEEVTTWVSQEVRGQLAHRPESMVLPGNGEAPERWIVSQLDNIRDYREAFAGQFGCSNQAAVGHVEALKVELDHHNIGYLLHRRLNVNEEDALRRTMRAVAPRHPELQELRDRVLAMLR